MDEQKAFEEWARGRGMDLSKLKHRTVPEGVYVSPDTRVAWEAWQAALNL